MEELTKICSKCGIEKTLDQYHKNKNYRLGVTAMCKECRNAQSRAWNQYHPKNVQAARKRYQHTDKCKAMWKRQHAKYREQRNAYCREWNKNNPGKSTEYMRKRTLREFGISEEQYSEMLKQQNNCCAICKRESNGGGRRLCIDHHHETGQIRSLLCADCNLAIGLLQESPEILRKATDYLERFQ